MKLLIKLTLFYTVLMVIAFLVLMVVNSNTDYEGRDITAYNKMVYEINEEYNAGTSIETLEEKYGCQIIFSTDLVDAEMTKFYADGALVIDFAPQGEIIGKVAWNDVSNKYQKKEKTLLKAVIIEWCIILVTGYLLLILIYMSMIRPLHDFENYSGEIAKGNLDVNLPMRRLNPFVNFTESFDIMREELIKARKKEADAEKAKRELVAEISHDIKTPVSTIKATCEVMDMNLKRKIEGETEPQDLKLMEDLQEKVGYISQKAETINQLVQNVFHLTIEEVDELQINVTENNSKEIEDYFLRLRNYGNIILDNHIPECLVYMDALRMEQVIDNICRNGYTCKLRGN